MSAFQGTGKIDDDGDDDDDDHNDDTEVCVYVQQTQWQNSKI